MKKQIIIVTVLLAISKMAMSQDPFFSQFRVSPMTLNPALMGSNMNKSTRISMISRNQWLGGSSQPYITSTIGYEQKLGEKQLGEDQLVLGLMMLNEKSNGGILSNSFFSAGLNYQNSLDAEGRNKLSGALSVTYSNRMLDLNNATFQSQFGSFGFMNSAAAYDPIGAVNNRYYDMNLGVAYEHVGEKVDFEIGGSLFHATKPKEGGALQGGQYVIDSRAVLLSSLKYRPSEKAEWLFGGNVQMQSSKQLLTLGTNYSIYINNPSDRNILTLGIWNRFNESLYPYLGFETNGWKFGLNYDIISSKIKSSLNSFQSIEASLTWEFGKKLTKKDKE